MVAGRDRVPARTLARHRHHEALRPSVVGRDVEIAARLDELALVEEAAES